jgi:hypothetical protein
MDMNMMGIYIYMGGVDDVGCGGEEEMGGWMVG